MATGDPHKSINPSAPVNSSSETAASLGPLTGPAFHATKEACVEKSYKPMQNSQNKAIGGLFVSLFSTSACCPVCSEQSHLGV